jgi:hypothetical protein
VNFLIDVTASVPNAFHGETYAAGVLELSGRRAGVRAASDVVKMANDRAEAIRPGQLLTKATDLLQKKMERFKGGSIRELDAWSFA